MPRVVEKTVYQYDELSESAKEKARDWYCQGIGEDWSPDYDDFTTCAEAIGITMDTRSVKLMGGGTRQDPDITYSIGHQGEYAAYKGSWEYSPTALEDLHAHCQEGDLETIVNELVRANTMAVLMGFSELRGTIQFNHHGTMEITAFGDTKGDEDELPPNLGDIVTEQLAGFAQWMLKQMKADYEGQFERESVEDTITANAYEFDEEGDRA